MGVNQFSADEPAAVTIEASVPVTSPPRWAVSQRALFDLIDEAWPVFEEAFCRPDGSLAYDGVLSTRDGGDDFYETFFNWPQFYLLGGSSAILDASKKHWRGTTDQLTRLGIVRDDFEIGYDWFHQGESLLFAYFLSAATPSEWRERAAKFAELYVDPANGNFDSRLGIIRAPHTGSGGARVGLSESEYYPWLADEAKKYGFPLDWMPGSGRVHEDLADDPRLGHEMHDRLGNGDVVANLAIAGLVQNAYILTGDERYAAWISRYVTAWKERAETAGGLVPDNVGPDGVVGSMIDGRPYGGHYGWSWPHGLYSLGQATAVGSLAAAAVTGDDSFLDLVRAQYDGVIANGTVGRFRDSDSSVPHWWNAHLGADVDTPTFLVPYRRSDRGWFDWNPVALSVPLALWHYTASDDDLARILDLQEKSGYDWGTVRPMREKEEGGHEEAWFTYLRGENPDYPELILEAAQYQVRRRLALIAEHRDDQVREEDIHIWQLVQPVVCEALCQLTLGGPQVIYNGGLLQARVRWFDALERRPGLPEDVAALVSSIDPARTTVELVNLSPNHHREVILQAGAFAEHHITNVTYDAARNSWAGSFYSYIGEPVVTTSTSLVCDTPYLTIALPPGTRITLTLALALRAKDQTYLAPWDVMTPSESTV